MIGKESSMKSSIFFIVLCSNIATHTMENESYDPSHKAQEEFNLEIAKEKPNVLAIFFCLSVFNKPVYEEVKGLEKKYKIHSGNYELLKKTYQEKGLLETKKADLQEIEDELQNASNNIIAYLKNDIQPHTVQENQSQKEEQSLLDIFTERIRKTFQYSTSFLNVAKFF